MKTYKFQTCNLKKLHLYGYGNGEEALIYLDWLNSGDGKIKYEAVDAGFNEEQSTDISVNLRELLNDLDLLDDE